MSGKFRGCNTVSAAGWSRWGAGLTLVAVAVVMVALAIPSSALAISEAFTPQRITTGATQASHQKVSGDRIVWQASDGSHLQIYTWTPTGSVVKLTSGTTDQTLPEVSGDRIVWQGSDGTTSQIYTWTPTGGVVQVSDSTTSNNTAPQISGDRIVWQASDGTNLQIYSWTPTDGIVKLTSSSTDQTLPEVSGDRVVWQGSNGTTSEIYTWDPTDGVSEVSDNTSTNNTVPQVSGDRIVWQGFNGTSLKIYTWTPTAGVVKITTDGSADTSPQVSGDTVVWTNYSSAYDVYMWTPSGGVSDLTENISPSASDPTPQIDGDRIVWAGDEGGMFGYVASWRSLVGPILVTQSNYSVSGPQVSGARVVWAQQSTKGGSFDIYTASATTIPDPTITSISPNFGPGSGGTTVTINGTGFDAEYGVDVTFGGVEAKNITVVSDTKVTAVSPAHQAGTVQIKATTWVGATAETSADDFEYIASPGTSESFKTIAIAKFASQDSSDSSTESDVSLSGDRLAWDAYDGTAWQVYTWDPVAGTQKISTSSYDNSMPIVSGDRVVWTSIDNADSDWQVFTWTPTAGTVQLTQGGQQGWASGVDGDRVVWSGTSSSADTGSEIYTWTPATGTVAITSTAVDSDSPTVSGDRIVWMLEGGTQANPTSDIMTWTPTGGTVRLTNNGAINMLPDVSGNRVVWTDEQDVYTWTVGATAPQKLTVAGTTVGQGAVVDGNRVVWTADNDTQGTGAVYTWTPTGGIVCLSVDNVEPGQVAVSGDRVVWGGSSMSSVPSNTSGSIGEDIYSWIPGAGITMVSSGKGESYDPCVSGDRLAWVDDDGIDTTVMSALPVPTVNSITPSSGLPAGGNTVTINGTVKGVLFRFTPQLGDTH
jgi:beta propeller repeat protein